MTASLEERTLRWTVDQFLALHAAGVVGAGDRLELVDGKVVEQVPIDPPHAGTTKLLSLVLHRRVLGRLVVSVQDPLVLGPHDMPQPDVAVLLWRDDVYTTRHPTPEDAVVVVEVADSSAESDRRDKLPRYARAGVVGCWLVDVQRRVVEVHRSPGPDGYADVTTHADGEVVAQADDRVRVAVADVLPPQG